MTKAEELRTVMLAEPRWTLAVAESLTAGNLQARIASASGASNYFLGGITAYSLEQKVRQLGVERAHAEVVNCVSADVAEQMACGVCRMFRADVGAATTGYAEPASQLGVSVPFAWWAVAVRKAKDAEFAVRSGRVEIAGANREEVQRRVADVVIEEIARAVAEARK